MSPERLGGDATWSEGPVWIGDHAKARWGADALLPREALEMVRIIAGHGLCGMEVVEVSPPYDVNDNTSQNYYFFINGKLWKWYKAFNASVFQGFFAWVSSLGNEVGNQLLEP